MTTTEKHNRKLGLVGVSLTKARPPPHDIEVGTEIMDELGPVLDSSGYLDEASFEWVTVALRYGLKNEEKPHYQRINKKYGDLPLAIELDTNELIESDREGLKRLFILATLRALIHAGQKYNLPIQPLEKLRDDLSATE